MVLSVVATLGYFATSLKKHVMLSRRDSSITNQATPLVRDLKRKKGHSGREAFCMFKSLYFVLTMMQICDMTIQLFMLLMTTYAGECDE